MEAGPHLPRPGIDGSDLAHDRVVGFAPPPDHKPDNYTVEADRKQGMFAQETERSPNLLSSPLAHGCLHLDYHPLGNRLAAPHNHQIRSDILRAEGVTPVTVNSNPEALDRKRTPVLLDITPSFSLV